MDRFYIDTGFNVFIIEQAMIIQPYKVILKRNRTAYIVDDEGIEYMKFEPHPDGDPWMDMEGVQIILDKLKIPWQNGDGWIVDCDTRTLHLQIEREI